MSASTSHTKHDQGRTASAVAQVPGLRHIDDGVVAGLHRVRTGKSMRVGKRFVPAFVVEDASGARVHDTETLERIRKLAIPPAWENVWICPYPNGHIQATGRDARGRKQYRYHARWREVRDRTKYSRLVDFAGALPALRRRVNADLKAAGLTRRKVLAAVVRLLETTFIRVGNEEYARTNHSFGLTTLKDRHVDFGPGEVRFHFRGKSGVSHQVAVHDPRVARIVKRCRDLPGQELFQYPGDDGRIQTIDSADVNQYIRDIAGEDFTAKDFRTWAGTVLASVAFHELAGATDEISNPNGRRSAKRTNKRAVTGATTLAPAAAALLTAMPRTRTVPRRSRGRGGVGGRPSIVNPPPHRPTQRNVVQAIKRVAERLGNTPSVCRKCYVHPAVIASYLSGKLGAALKNFSDATTNGGGGTKRSSGRHTGQGTVRQRLRTAPGLRPEEAAVLAVLKSANQRTA